MVRRVYFEFTVQGGYVKVAAIDDENGLEVSIVGTIATPRPELERLALMKLDFVKNKIMKGTKKEVGPGVLT